MLSTLAALMHPSRHQAAKEALKTRSDCTIPSAERSVRCHTSTLPPICFRVRAVRAGRAPERRAPDHLGGGGALGTGLDLGGAEPRPPLPSLPAFQRMAKPIRAERMEPVKMAILAAA